MKWNTREFVRFCDKCEFMIILFLFSYLFMHLSLLHDSHIYYNLSFICICWVNEVKTFILIWKTQKIIIKCCGKWRKKLCAWWNFYGFIFLLFEMKRCWMWDTEGSDDICTSMWWLLTSSLRLFSRQKVQWIMKFSQIRSLCRMENF
jgi:hypothetical protein